MSASRILYIAAALLVLAAVAMVPHTSDARQRAASATATVAAAAEASDRAAVGAYAVPQADAGYATQSVTATDGLRTYIKAFQYTNWWHYIADTTIHGDTATAVINDSYPDADVVRSICTAVSGYVYSTEHPDHQVTKVLIIDQNGAGDMRRDSEGDGCQ